MLSLYTDEFQMLVQKSYIVLYHTEPGVQSAKGKNVYKILRAKKAKIFFG